MSDEWCAHGPSRNCKDCEIERLTAEREHYKGKAEVWEDAARSLQARVEALECALQQIIDEIPPNEHKKWKHHHHYLFVARTALAATEQGENDE